jgi:spermidine synthase
MTIERQAIPTVLQVAPLLPISRGFRFTLLLLVFCGGVAVMGLEMTASQLIAPYFGSTISVWTSLIGLVMVFLTIGYYLGGALADRHPSRAWLGGIVLVAGLAMLVMPLLSKPILMAVWQLTPKIGLLGSAMIGTFILLSLPNILLGCVCPFAMKLSIQDLGCTGRAAGKIYAISAIGSVIGTFLPALITIQLFGVRRSIMLFGAGLMAAALLLLSRSRYIPAAAALLLLALPLSPMLPTRGMIAEKETPYNYLQVVQAGPTRLLIVDWGAFSFYTPGKFRTGQYYDYLMLAPLLRPEPPAQWLHNMLVIGLGAGTISKQATEAFGAIAIDGVEIDPGIVDLGRKYFDMKETNLKVHETDGRAFLANSTRPYDWVVVDAYQGSEIPFHLVTREFFQQLKDHMSPDGVLSINVAWWKKDDSELLQRLTATVKTVFPRVCAITAIGDSSAVLLAGGKDASPKNLMANAKLTGFPALTEIAGELGGKDAPRVEFPAGLGEPFTDDRTVVDKIVDRMYLQARQEAYDREFGAMKL